MKDADLKHLTGYADELFEQGDSKTAKLIYALVHECDTLTKATHNPKVLRQLLDSAAMTCKPQRAKP